MISQNLAANLYAEPHITVAHACSESGSNAKKSPPFLIPISRSGGLIKKATMAGLKMTWRSPLKRVSIIIIIASITLFAVVQTHSLAQQKKPVGKKTTKPAPAPTPDMRAQAGLVAGQIKNVSNFIYLFGKIVNGFEVADEQAKSNQLPDKIAAMNKESKEKLVAKIKDLRAGLEGLATGIQADQSLQVQYLKISYATEAVVDAERLTQAERYDEAGKSLIAVVERLTDTIVSMRLP